MSPKTWTVGELLKVTADYLQRRNVDSPRLSAEILLAHQLRLERIQLYLNFEQPLNEDEVGGYRSLIRRRLNREPIQYITGVQEFWSLEFNVGPRVLVPRPETEGLVEQVIDLYKGKKLSNHPKILDLGTGCGAIAIALAKEIPEAEIWASDISQGALDAARQNAYKHGVDERIHFVLGDLFQPFRDGRLLFEVIVSNPPYIPSDVFGSLTPEVKDHEPRLALDGGEDGMTYIKKIVLEGADYLIAQGWILVEMDPDQTSKAVDLMERSGRYHTPIRVKDYSRRYRMVMARSEP
jgi:release factor glutamine methyltransferase